MGEREGTPYVATLSPVRRDLYSRWEECEFGIGGRKDARRFTPHERGRVRFKYSRRKVSWGVLDHLVRSGYTARAACDNIYEAYGKTTISNLTKN